MKSLSKQDDHCATQYCGDSSKFSINYFYGTPYKTIYHIIEYSFNDNRYKNVATIYPLKHDITITIKDIEKNV